MKLDNLIERVDLVSIQKGFSNITSIRKIVLYDTIDAIKDEYSLMISRIKKCRDIVNDPQHIKFPHMFTSILKRNHDAMGEILSDLENEVISLTAIISAFEEDAFKHDREVISRTGLDIDDKKRFYIGMKVKTLKLIQAVKQIDGRDTTPPNSKDRPSTFHAGQFNTKE